jgi:hypothetical protein
MAEKEWSWLPIAGGKKVKIDAEDHERVSAHRWTESLGTNGRPRVTTSIKTPKGPRKILLGRFLLNPPGDLCVFSLNHEDPLDFRKQFLIICTRQEQQRLLPKRRRQTSSTYRGVSRCGTRWRASIQAEGRSYNVGTFSTEEDAALAYNRNAIRLFGDKCFQNIVRSDS